MPARPRIVIQSFADSEDPMLAAWLRFRDAVVAAVPADARVTGSRAPGRGGSGVGISAIGELRRSPPGSRSERRDGGQPGARVPEIGSVARPARPLPDDLDDEPIITVWRLLASNNRELARSALSYATPRTALTQLDRIRPHADELEVVQVTGPRGDRNGWYLAFGPMPALTCSRWYGAAASSLEAADAARFTIGEATVDERVQVLSVSRRRPVPGARR